MSKKASGTVKTGKAPAASIGDVLWLEPFTGFSNSAVPASSNASTTVYGGGSVTYACTGSGTKVYASDNNAGGAAAGELLIYQDGGTLTVTGIPTGEATAMTLSFKSNNGCTPTSTTVGATIGSNLGSDNSYVYSVSVPSNTESITLVFTNSKKSTNTRVDDLKLVAGAPVPNITVATSDATGTTSGTGTTATLKGTITLVNGAEWSDITECGFKYKTGSDDYTTVTVTTPTSGSSANISKAVSGLTNPGRAKGRS